MQCNQCLSPIDCEHLGCSALVTVEEQNLVYRLRKRADIRRHAHGRKSVEDGQVDRIAALLDEAAMRIEDLQREKILYKINHT